MSKLWIVYKQFEKWHRMRETWTLPTYGVRGSLASMRTRGWGRVEPTGRADGLALTTICATKATTRFRALDIILILVTIPFVLQKSMKQESTICVIILNKVFR